MRESLFKGKRTDNGEWVYGSPIFQDTYVLIRFWNGEEFEYEEYLVAPESVSEFTGLTDKNGKKIFEGDLLKGISNLVWLVAFEKGSFVCKDEEYKTYFNFYEHKHFDDYEIIGNIHDNPELLVLGV